MRTRSKALNAALRNGLLKSSDAERLGLTRTALSRLVADGKLVRVSRGVYASPELDLSSQTNLALAQQRVPGGVVCLLSALQFHQLTTQLPNRVWIMVDSHAWRPAPAYPPLQLVYASAASRLYGVEQHKFDGLAVRVTSAAKTVADCFKYRSKVGLDVALEALQDYRRKRKPVDALWAAAKADRVTRVMRPYLEATG